MMAVTFANRMAGPFLPSSAPPVQLLLRNPGGANETDDLCSKRGPGRQRSLRLTLPGETGCVSFIERATWMPERDRAFHADNWRNCAWRRRIRVRDGSCHTVAFSPPFDIQHPPFRPATSKTPAGSTGAISFSGRAAGSWEPYERRRSRMVLKRRSKKPSFATSPSTGYAACRSAVWRVLGHGRGLTPSSAGSPLLPRVRPTRLPVRHLVAFLPASSQRRPHCLFSCTTSSGWLKSIAQQ